MYNLNLEDFCRLFCNIITENKKRLKFNILRVIPTLT